MRLLVKRLRESWPEVSIIFRGDSAFARPRILYWCEENQVDYVVGIAGNKRLQRETADLVEQAQQQYDKTQAKQRLFSDFTYSAKSWRRSRRIIAKAEHHENGSNLRFLVTNMQQDAQTLYDEGYCPRGDMENGIKQLKLDLSSDRNSCSKFLANQFRLPYLKHQLKKPIAVRYG